MGILEIEFSRTYFAARLSIAAALVIAVAACETRESGRYRDTGEPAGVATAPKSESDRAAGQAAFGSGPVEVYEAEEELDPGLRGPEIYLGNDTFSTPSSGLPPESLEGGRVTLNFAGADIREVANVILGDTLNVSYVIDPAVEGTVTVRTSRPIDREDVIPALENILSLNNAALVYSDGLYKILPIEAAATSLTQPNVQPTRANGSRGFGINIIPLRHVSAAAIRDVLQPFIAPGRQLRFDEARNILIYSGSGVEAQDLTEMVRIFDVDWMSGMSFGMFPIQVADPEVLIAELEQIFNQGTGNVSGGVLRFIPIERLNAILVISPRAKSLQQAASWIDRLDRGSEGVGRRIFVYNVQNARAGDLAEILSQVFTESGGGTDAGLPRPSVAPGLSQVDVTPEAEDTRAAREDAEAEGTQQRVQENAPAQTSGLRQQVSGSPLFGEFDAGSLPDSTGDIRIIADERNNSLVVLATPVEFKMIETTLKRLDVVPLQVLIEVTIADVTLNDDLRYGLQWFFSQGDSSATFSSLLSGAVSSAFPGFSYVFASNDVNVVLNALTQITDVTIVSSPSLMVLDNQSARLQVGDEVPIATQSAVSVTDPDAPIVNSIQFRDTGVILEVTPRVNAGGLVELDVRQEVSNVVATTTSDIDSPTIQTRTIESTVAVQSGEAIALGGLIQDEKEDGTTGIPLLSTIPIVGNLFKTTVDDYFRRELLVLITPRVVRNQREAREVTEELRRRLRAIEPLESTIQ